MSVVRSGIAKLTLVLACVAMVASVFMPANSAQAWSAPRTVYFQETGHTLDQFFLDKWRENNGWLNYGLPITEEIQMENGVIVQYLQYARFEYWPQGNENGEYVVTGRVGEELRPAALQRSMIASTGGGGGGTGVTDVLKAWLPVQPDSPVAKNPDHTYIEATSHTIFGGFRDWWYANGSEGYLGNPLSQEYKIGDTTYQVFEYGQLKLTAENGIELVPVGQKLAGKYNISTAAVAQGDIPTYDEALFVPPGPSYGNYVPGGGEVWVDISLSQQYLRIFQGDVLLLDTYISSGKDGWETPTGTFYVNRMYVSDTMVGDVAGENWFVPDVPHVLYFTNQGHAIHGTYWHSNFGTRLSHGCINMSQWTAEYLYSIAYVGMRIEIHW